MDDVLSADSDLLHQGWQYNMMLKTIKMIFHPKGRVYHYESTLQLPVSLYLIQILPSKEGLIGAVFLKKGREAVGLLGLLPCCAAAVALQRVVDHMMVMGIFACQDTRPAGTAKGTGNKLGERRNDKKC